jgi:hypothetical protein
MTTTRAQRREIANEVAAAKAATKFARATYRVAVRALYAAERAAGYNRSLTIASLKECGCCYEYARASQPTAQQKACFEREETAVREASVALFEAKRHEASALAAHQSVSRRQS